MDNRTMPPCTIIPVLGYFNIDEAIAWLSKNFGFAERWRLDNHRAQLSFGTGAVSLTGLKPESVFTPGTLLVRVPDLDAHYRHAKEQGVQILHEPVDYPYGERQYTAADLNGHCWVFTQSIKDTLPEDWGGKSGSL